MKSLSPEISIVIPAFNEESTIGRCLESLTKLKTKRSFEVILVDNNSTDQTSKVAASYSSQLNLKIIKETRKGRGTARATGFNAARGSIIFSTDADTEIPSNWLDELAPHIGAEVVGVTGTMRINDCSPMKNKFVNFIQPNLMHWYRVLYGHYWLSGFNFAIDRGAYEKSGGFNPKLNAHEDIDLSLRVSKIGKIQFLDNVPVLASGRRLKKGIVATLVDYCTTSINYHILKKKEVFLSDVR